VTSSVSFALLLRRSLVALLVCAAAVLVCYLFVDRPVACFVHRHKLADDVVLRWLTYFPPLVQAWTPLVLAALLLRRAFGPFRRCELAVLTACVSMIVADQLRESLGYVFGRYWPETWIDNNPSFIKDGAYGFHPFHSGSAYGSFPSGHMARTVGLVSVVWVAYPGWRWACGLASLAVAAGLLGMNYHFVSDVIAGSFVGGVVGMYAASLAALNSKTPVPEV
jgi:membrane-associated phospholipid phosphatase